MFDCPPEAVVQTHADAFNARDLEGIAASYAPGAIVEFYGRSDLELNGAGAIRSYYAVWFAAPAHWTIEVRSQQQVEDVFQVSYLLLLNDRPARSEIWRYQVANCQIEHVLQIQSASVLP